MADVTFDGRSFLVDGNRICLVSGSIHYFRVPSELWRDRLIKAKRAGLNCVCTYVAWNFHEPEEGVWKTEGDHDLAEFIRIADELGLYVILRPGPYICAEWDFGGLPGWLTAKTGMSVRNPSAAYTHYYDKYLANILPPLADLQVTRGGNIILIQNENEYYMDTVPDRLSYLEFISQLFRRAGFEVPIITCNCLTEPQVPDTIECVNTWSDCVGQIKRLRNMQDHAPALVTEFWDGWFDFWGSEHHTRDARETARRAMEVLGCGAQYNYYMWHGGTNFGFWGSRLVASDAAWQTTSYDYDAPLAEGGGLTDKYYYSRLPNLLGRHMARWLGDSELADAGANLTDTPDVLNAVGDRCRWAVVTNNGRDDITTATVSLPDGKRVEVNLAPLGATAVPIGLQLTEKHNLDYANCTPLGFFGEKLLVLHAPTGWGAKVSINGNVLEAAVSADEPVVIEHRGLNVALLSSEQAMRTWVMEEELLIGPDFVGETDEEIVPAKGSQHVQVLSFGGKLSRRKAAAGNGSRTNTPRLGKWSRVAVCPEAVDAVEAPEGWHALDRPRDVDKLGVHYGYCWYRIEFEEDRPRRRNLLLPECEDRATLFVNGKRVGLWGRGEEATRQPISVQVKKGRNVLVAMVDNMGRMSYGPKLGEPKGLFGHVWDAKPITRKRFRMSKQENFSKRCVPRSMTWVLPQLEQLPLQAAELDISLKKPCPVHLSFSDLPHHVAVFCNNRLVGFYPAHRTNWGEVSLSGHVKEGKNLLRLLVWGDIDSKTLAGKIDLHELQHPISGGANWSYRPWGLPSGEEPKPDTVTGRPGWFSAKFKYTPCDQPLFVQLQGVRKGQLYLNGRNVGRFWTVGPQEWYYLPEPWLQEENELLLFEEQGKLPQKCKLKFLPQGPYRS